MKDKTVLDLREAVGVLAMRANKAVKMMGHSPKESLQEELIMVREVEELLGAIAGMTHSATLIAGDEITDLLDEISIENLEEGVDETT